MSGFRLLALILFCNILAGCGTTPELEGTSGFLSQYENLQPQDAGDKARYIDYVSSAEELNQYDRLLVNPVMLHISHETIETWGLQPERYEQLQAYFTNQLNYRLGQHYRLAPEPGKDILRLRVAITVGELQTSSQEPYQALPRGLVVNGDSRNKVLSIYEEGELVDSITGKQIAALVGGFQAGSIDIEALNRQPGKVLKPLIDAWVDTFCRTLPSCH